MAFFAQSSLKRIVLKNSFWLFVTNVVSRLSKLLLIPFATRILGPEQFGFFSYTIVLITTVFLFSDMGLTYIFRREYPKYKDAPQRIISTIFYMKTVLFTLAVTACVAIYWLGSHEPGIKAIFMIVLGIILLDRIKMFFIHLSQANNRMEHEAFSTLAENLLTTALGIVVLALTQSLMAYAWASLMGSLMGLVVILFYNRHEIPLPRYFDASLVKGLFILMIPFMGSILAEVLLTSTDTLMIQWMIGATAVGFYHAAIKAIEMVRLVSYFISMSIYPIIASLYNDLEKLTQVVQKGIRLILIFVMPITIGGLLVAEPLITLLFGTEFTPATGPFKLLLASLLPTTLLTCYTYTLLTLNKQVLSLSFGIITSLLNVLLNLLLIPKYGIIGATLASTIAAYLNCVLCGRLLGSCLKIKLFEQTLLKTSIASFAFAPLVYFGIQHLSLFWVIPCAALVYAGALWVLREQLTMEALSQLRLPQN